MMIDPDLNARFYADFASAKQRVLARIRGEVGWPEEDGDVDVDLMWAYIAALENKVAADAWMRSLP